MPYKVEFHPEVYIDFANLDGSIKKEIAKKINALSENPYLGKPLGNKFGIDLTGFYKLYVGKKKYRIVYHLVGDCLEVVEIVGIGKRDKAEIYKMVAKRLEAIRQK